MRRFLSVMCVAATISSGATSSTLAETKVDVRLCEREMQNAARKYDVPLGILYSVGITETGKGNSLHPYAMNIEGKPYYARSIRDGQRKVAWEQARGKKLIDVGCMQINIHYHGHRFASVSDMFRPRQNVQYAARFLSELKKREGSWTMAVARYHAGPNNNPAQKRYICRVITNMVASGFGKWTPEARTFCN
ncbi:lytic transglycosylase domain-containing protein [Rhodobacteraceae bacterium RKSG542]|uniref:transglycosylase SLT domain-containing protein n=1 Tax=Pseudovibrio flavus TaxID=2529854 RepID=UPI0012BC1F5B|nr:lytic transglycosylase domain-containing protein [Pseudovibrio flavus]MTI16769.1 lytic transglycosylase domain-containing protein [Pseudovibrio flavus]